MRNCRRFAFNKVGGKRSNWSGSGQNTSYGCCTDNRAQTARRTRIRSSLMFRKIVLLVLTVTFGGCGDAWAERHALRRSPYPVARSPHRSFRVPPAGFRSPSMGSRAPAARLRVPAGFGEPNRRAWASPTVTGGAASRSGQVGMGPHGPVPVYGYGYSYDPYAGGSFRAPDLLDDPLFRAQHKFDSHFPGRYSRRPPLVLRHPE